MTNMENISRLVVMERNIRQFFNEIIRSLHFDGHISVDDLTSLHEALKEADETVLDILKEETQNEKS